MPLRGRARKRTPSAAARVPRYGTEAGLVRSFIERSQAAYDGKRGSLLQQVIYLIIFEFKLAGLSMLVGPFLLWRSALTLFRGVVFPTEGSGGYVELAAAWMTPRFDVASTAAEDRLLHCRILIILEAVFQSVPQALLQTTVFLSFSGSIDINLYLFSAVCSLGVSGFAFMNLAQHRWRVRQLVDPPTGEFAVHLATQCDAEQLDSAALLADIAAARGAGVQSADVHSAVLRLKEARVEQARALHANGCSPRILLGASYTALELFAAGVSAAQFGAAGLTLAELEALGYSLRELRDAGHTTKELHAAGHTLAELVAAGATAAEVKALAVFSAAEMRTAGLEAAALKGAGYGADELKAAGYSAIDLKLTGWSVAELKVAGCSAVELRQAGSSVFELRSAGFPNSELQGGGAADPSSAPNSTTTLLLEGPSARGSRVSGMGTPPRKQQQITNGHPRHTKTRDDERDENAVYTKLPPNFPDGTSTPWLNNRLVPPSEHRPMPPATPAPIYNKSGQQINKQYWSNKTMGYVGTSSFAR